MNKSKREAIFSQSEFHSNIHNDTEWDFHGQTTNEHLHSIHPYPARFIPQIPRKAILKWSKPGDLILDPFCGCGTTLLESEIWGRNAIGVDNNAVAILISQAKTIKYSDEDFEALLIFKNNLEKCVKISKSDELWIPEYNNVNYWFNSEAIEDLSKLKSCINRLPKNACLLASAIFSSIIVRVSNQDSDTRYSCKPYPYPPGNAIKIFKKKLSQTILRAQEINDNKTGNIQVVLADSRNLNFIEDSNIDLIVTSPPYLNAYDYHKYHRHRLHWINGDVLFARDNEIGKHDVFTRPNANPDQYFIDMDKCMKEWSRILKENGKAVIVIGDAIVNKKPVDVADRFIEIGENHNLQISEGWIRNLEINKKSFNQKARINREHVLLFTKLRD